MARSTTTAPNRAKKASTSLLGGMLLGAGVGIALVYLGLQVGGALGRAHRASGGSRLALSGTQELVLFSLVVVALFGTLLAHELGHLLGGRLVGFRAFLLIVGPLKLQRGASGWRASLNRSLALAGGLAGSAPTDTHRLRQRMAVMVAGGPVTSLVTGSLALLLAVQLRPFDFNATTPFTTVVLAAFGGLFGMSSLAIAAATLIPGQTSGFRTDGAQLLRLARGGADADRAAALAATIGMSLAGTRPRDLPDPLLDAILAVRDESMEEISGWQLAQSVAADRGNVAQARALLDRIVEHVDRLPEISVPGVYYDAAAQYASWGDVTMARAMLEAAGDRRAFGAEYLASLARGAVHAVSGETEAARRELSAARAALRTTMVPGSVPPTEDLLARLEARLA